MNDRSSVSHVYSSKFSGTTLGGVSDGVRRSSHRPGTLDAVLIASAHRASSPATRTLFHSVVEGLNLKKSAYGDDSRSLLHAASGVDGADGLTWADYVADLDRNLTDLSQSWVLSLASRAKGSMRQSRPPMQCLRIPPSDQNSQSRSQRLQC
jgi:hypothetical protein